MESREASLREQLDAFGPGIIALVGGGGKTSLLFLLGKSLSERGASVLLTTTTKMFRPEPDEWLEVALREEPPSLAVSGGRALFAARPPRKRVSPEKVRGYSPEEIDELAVRRVAEWIVVEADGAAGRPIKAPAAHEPVVPSRTSIAVAVLGLGCMNRPFEHGNVFRGVEFSAVTGLAEGDEISPEAVARLATHPEGMFKNTPHNAVRVLFCNQADLPGAQASGVELSRELSRHYPGIVHRMFLGSLQQKGLRCRLLPTE